MELFLKNSRTPSFSELVSEEQRPPVLVLTTQFSNEKIAKAH